MNNPEDVFSYHLQSSLSALGNTYQNQCKIEVLILDVV